MKPGFLEKLLDRIGRVQPEEIEQLVGRLAQEKGFLENLFNAIQEGIIVADMSGQVVYLNSAAAEFFSLDPEDSIGRPLEQCIPGLPWEAVATTDGVTSRDLEIFYPENRYLNFYATPIRVDPEAVQKATKRQVEEDEPVGVAMIVRDITETRKSTQETIESERLSALTLLAAGVAHEIGNPLNSLTIHLQIMERRLRKLGERAQKELGESVTVARDEIKRLDFIINQFLRAIRPTTPEMQPTNINEVILESLSFLSGEIGNRDILVETQLHEPLPNVRVDRNQMKQAFYNIIKNSTQAMSQGGILHVQSERTDEFVIVSFRDTGGGISEENMARIFQPYFSTKETGTGLGLLIVRRIVREHGGEIQLDSREGEGLTFRLLLPLFDRQVRLLKAGKDRDTEEETK